MDSNLTSIEVIGLAIRSEEEASHFYGHISQMVENDLVSEKYRGLAREEAAHRKMLVELYMEMTGSDEHPPHIPGEPETAEGGGVPEGVSDSLEDLLKIAIKREQNAQDFYRKAADRAKDLTGRRTLEYLADVEQGHELMLKGELQAYNRDRDWYTGKQWPELTHVGP